MTDKLNRHRIIFAGFIAGTFLFSTAVYAQAGRQSITVTCDVGKNLCSTAGTSVDGQPIVSWTSWWTTAPDENKRANQSSKKKQLKGTDAPFSDAIPCEMDKGNGVVYHVSALDTTELPIKEMPPKATVTVACY